MASRKLIPLLDRVLIQRAAQQTKTAGGIILPDTQKKLNEGVVVAVGPGARDKNGQLVPLSVKEGDKVLLPEYGGQQVKLDTTEYTLVREADLLAIIQ